MTIERKRRVVTIALVAFAIWPLLHHTLVLAADINPWHLAGWSMYIKPRTPMRISVYRIEGPPREPERILIHMSDTPARVRQRLSDFNRRRRVYGKLLPPRSLARLYFRTWKSIQRLEIVISTWDLEAGSGMFVRRDRRYHYQR